MQPVIGSRRDRIVIAPAQSERLDLRAVGEEGNERLGIDAIGERLPQVDVLVRLRAGDRQGSFAGRGAPPERGGDEGLDRDDPPERPPLLDRVDDHHAACDHDRGQDQVPQRAPPRKPLPDASLSTDAPHGKPRMRHPSG
jgi:hypothetical protein